MIEVTTSTKDDTMAKDRCFTFKYKPDKGRELAVDLADKLMDNGDIKSFSFNHHDRNEVNICGGDEKQIMKELKKYSR